MDKAPAAALSHDSKECETSRTCLRSASRKMPNARQRCISAFKIYFYNLLAAYTRGLQEKEKTLQRCPSKTHRHRARRGLRRVSLVADHSTRAGSTIGSPAYVGRFEWSTYFGRLPAPSLKTNFGVSPRDQAKVCQQKCREDTRTASGFVIARKKYSSITYLESFGLRVDRIDLSVSSFQCLPSANANRSTSLSHFGFVHTHLRGIWLVTTRGHDATETILTAHARLRAGAAAPRSGGRANATVAPSRFAKPRRVQKTRLGRPRISLNFGVKGD